MRSFYLILIILFTFCHTKISAQQVYIADISFFQKLVNEGVDKNKNNKIEFEEALLVETLSLNTFSINDLTGIEAFTNLVYLDFSQNKVKNVDLSKNTKLKYIYCSQIDSLMSLNIFNCLDLEELECGYTRIGNIDLSKFVKLRVLNCLLSRRSELDVSKNTNLTFLGALYNRFSTVDLSNNPQLSYLDVSWGRVTSLDVTKNPKLTYLDVSGNTGLSSICVFDTNYAKTNPKFKKDATQKWTQNCTVTGIANEELETNSYEQAIYPNPSYEEAYLKIPNLTEPVQLKVTDMSGKTMFEQLVSTQETEINTSQLAAGTYYLSFIQNNKVINKKMTVMK